MTDDAKRIAALRRSVLRARKNAAFLDPFSRHLHIMADHLSKGKPYPMLTEEPEHCAYTMLAVLESLWKARTKAKGDV